MSHYLTAAELHDVCAPTATALGLPNRTYTDPACLDIELATVFRRTWVAVDFAHRLAEPGSARPITVGGIGVVLVCDHDGVLRAFHNTNRYDACALVTEPMAGLHTLQSGYHGLTWALDGRLLAYPYFDGTPQPALPGDGSLDLTSVACDRWLDLVFVCLEPKDTLAQHVAPASERLKELTLDGLSPACGNNGRPFVSVTDIPGNWKIAFENDVDVYHEAFVHEYYAQSPHAPKVDAGGRPTYEDINDRGLHGLAVPADFYDDEEAGAYPEIPSVGEPRTIIADLFPNAQLGVMRDHLTLGFHDPVAVDLTRNSVAYYTDVSVATDAEVTAEVSAIWEDARREDDVAVSATQRGRTTTAFNQTCYSPFWDASLHAFHRRVAHTVMEGVASEGNS